MLVGSMLLLFARLGHYSLWTDEATTAITGVGVWHTGDTSAWLNDHNLVTYRDGLLLKNQKDRYTSPLAFYLVAPFIGLLGSNSFAARLPFAICGLGTVLLMIRWLRRANPSNMTWISAAIILLNSVSFFLFQRQCRYYAPATFLSVWIAYLYCHWNGTRRQLLGIGVAMALLLATQYLDYAALVGCLLIDYGIFGRRRQLVRGLNWLVLAMPQIAVGAIVCPIWNPIARAASAAALAAPSHPHAGTPAVYHPWIVEYLRLVWWNLRDMTASEFVVLPLIVLCPILYFKRRDVSLLRAPLALLVFVGGIAFFTAHPLPAVGNAEVRYLAPVIPLCIGIGISAVSAMQSLRGWAQALLLGIAGISIAWQSSAVDFYRELIRPSVEPYTPVASWIGQNVPPLSSVYVASDMCVGPVMWAAPQPTYVWQLSDPPKPDYAQLPAFYLKGRVPPDFMIAFGPALEEIKDWQQKLQQRDVHYERVATIPVYYKEMFRPEIIWRSFTTIEPKSGEEVFIFRRVTIPACTADECGDRQTWGRESQP